MNWRTDTARGNKAGLDLVQTALLPLGLVHRGRDCDLRSQARSLSIPMPGREEDTNCPHNMADSRRQSVTCHLCLQQSTGFAHFLTSLASTQPPWGTLAQPVPDGFPQAHSLQLQAPTLTWALPTLPTLFPEVFNEPAKPVSPLKARACVLLSPWRSWGSVRTISSPFLSGRACPSPTPNF